MTMADPDIIQVQRTRNQTLGAILNALLSRFPVQSSGTVTWPAASSVTVADANVTADSRIFLQATNASAGTLVAGATSPYISARSAGVSFTVTTASGGAAAGTETMNYLIVNLT